MEDDTEENYSNDDIQGDLESHKEKLSDEIKNDKAKQMNNNKEDLSVKDTEAPSASLIAGVIVSVSALVLIAIAGGVWWKRKRSKSSQIVSYLLTPYGKLKLAKIKVVLQTICAPN